MYTLTCESCDEPFQSNETASDLEYVGIACPRCTKNQDDYADWEESNTRVYRDYLGWPEWSEGKYQ